MNTNPPDRHGPHRNLPEACSRSGTNQTQSATPCITTLFVYGTLKSGQWNHDRYCHGAIRIESSTVIGRLYQLPQGYPALVIPEVHILAQGTADPLADAVTQARFAATVDPSSHPSQPLGDWGLILGELITFTDPLRALPPIDRLEGFRPGLGPSYYQRVLVPAWSGGRVHCAWTYVMPGVSRHSLLPDGVWPTDGNV